MAPPCRESGGTCRLGGAVAAILLALPAGSAPAAHADDAPPPAVAALRAPAPAAGEAREAGALAFDAGGVLYAADARHGTVVRLGPGGETLGVIGAGRLDRPAGVAVEQDGDVLVADRAGVHRFVAGGDAEAPAAFAAVPSAAGVAAAPDGSVYVTAPGRVVRLSPAGAAAAEWPADDPRGVGVAADGTVWVALAAAVARFTPDGAPLATAAADDPEGVATAADGSVLVGERGRDRVVRLAADGRPVEVVDRDLDEPRGVALDCRGGLAVSDDSSYGTVRRLTVPFRAHAPCPPAPAAAGVNGPAAAAAAPAAPAAPPAAALAPGEEPERPVARRPKVVPATAALAVEPAPVAGRTARAEPLSGTVLVRLPGRREMTPLRTATLLPMGTRIDTRAGRVRLGFATRTADFPRLGTAQTADVDSGVFSIHQPLGRSAVRLRLEGAGPPCGRPAYARPLGPRHLWVDAAAPSRQAVGARARPRATRDG
jgi:sugar lactone lactonase YvrE